MGKFVDLTGKRFGRLTVVERDCLKPKGGNSQWICKCDCGNFSSVSSSNLKKGSVVSCGCFAAENARMRRVTHGKKNTRLYRIWHGMKCRCCNPNDKCYKHYGGKGVTVCDEWANDFMKFYDWSMSNGYRDDLSIDRLDINGNYEPDNCRWATIKQQNNNTSRNRLITHNGETKTLKQWEEETGISRYAISSRLDSGWSMEDAMSIPAGVYHDYKKRIKNTNPS